MTKLYELTGQYLELMEMAEELEPEVFQDTLEMITEDINAKSENIAMLLRNIESDTEAIKTEEKRLADRRKHLETQAKNAKQYLQDKLEEAGIDKVPSTLFKIQFQNNPPSVQIADESKVPSNFMIAQEPRVDKKALKEALKNGDEIEGVSLVQQRGLRIK